MMQKRIIAVLGGVVCATVVVVFMEFLLQKIYPMPVGSNYHDKDLMADYIQKMPLSAMLSVLIGWAIASFICGYVIKKINKSFELRPPITGGLILTAFSVWNLMEFKHPVWFSILAVVIWVPMVLFGHKTAKIEDTPA